MAQFLMAFEETMKHEIRNGIPTLENDPDDRGGATYMGVSEKAHPDWIGWTLLRTGPHDDAWKVEMMSAVQELYKAEYWDKIDGDNMPSQVIASEVFDSAVNCGVKRAVKWLQVALNVCNRNERYWTDIKIDGVMGEKSMTALNHAIEEQSMKYVYKVLNICQGEHYMKLYLADPTQEKYIGWLNRVVFDLN